MFGGDKSGQRSQHGNANAQIMDIIIDSSRDVSPLNKSPFFN